MYSLLISVGIAVAAAAAVVAGHGGPGGAVAAGLAGFIGVQVAAGWFLRKKIKAVQDGLQEVLLNGQKQLNRKIQMFQSRPGGNIKQIQRQIEADQKALITDALAYLVRFEPFKKWNLLMEKQIATMRMQFLYQLKDFEAVDQLFATRSFFKAPLMFDPIAVAMKMARQYQNGDIAGLEKTFKQRIKWYRGSRGTLLYALMSWVYMKQNDPEKARQLLIKAKEATGDETIARNWELLSNNKEKHFSNDGLGEQWFALYLENPPQPKQQKVRMQARGGRPF